MANESSQCSNCHHRIVCQLRSDLAEKQSSVDEIEYIQPVVLECKYRSILKEEIERWEELNGVNLKEGTE